jgi:hypothetical protein
MVFIYEHMLAFRDHDVVRHEPCSTPDRPVAEFGGGAAMRLAELAKRIGADILTHAPKAEWVDVIGAAAGEKVSDLLDRTTPATLVLSGLTSPHLLRMAELLDAPGICLVGGAHPDAELIEAARARGKVIMVTAATLGEVGRSLPEGFVQAEGQRA